MGGSKIHIAAVLEQVSYSHQAQKSIGLIRNSFWSGGSSEPEASTSQLPQPVIAKRHEGFTKRDNGLPKISREYVMRYMSHQSSDRNLSDALFPRSNGALLISPSPSS